ncbi:MAG: hypothetical protein ACT4PM_12325 [Gemmatimonadales bacterium]
MAEFPGRMARFALRTVLGRRSWERVRESFRIRRLRRYVRRLKQEGARGQVDRDLLGAIRRAWGNEGWAADVGYLVEVANRTVVGTGPFLECGSGLTTVIAGAVAGARRLRVFTLEQNEEWTREMKALLDALEVEGVSLWHAPLIPQNDFVWFDLNGRELPAAFDVVFCDGPSVGKSRWTEEQTLNWRSGVVPVLKRMRIDFGEILLDDMDDPRSERLVARWQAEGLRTRVVSTPTGPLLVATGTFCDP